MRNFIENGVVLRIRNIYMCVHCDKQAQGSSREIEAETVEWAEALANKPNYRYMPSGWQKAHLGCACPTCVALRRDE